MRRWLVSAARLAFAAFLLVGGFRALRLAFDELRAAMRAVGETTLQARQRLFGYEYTRAIEQARSLIAPNEVYVLVDAGTFEQAARYWVRYDLAPRPARLLGFVSQLPNRRGRLQKRWPKAARYAVVAQPDYKPPLIMRRDEFFNWLEAVHAPD